MWRKGSYVNLKMLKVDVESIWNLLTKLLASDG